MGGFHGPLMKDQIKLLETGFSEIKTSLVKQSVPFFDISGSPVASASEFTRVDHICTGVVDGQSSAGD